jgi:predicted RNase H-like nuclease (RuvC/YqgF family)
MIGRSRVIHSSDEAWLAFAALPHDERGCCTPMSAENLIALLRQVDHSLSENGRRRDALHTAARLMDEEIERIDREISRLSDQRSALEDEYRQRVEQGTDLPTP